METHLGHIKGPEEERVVDECLLNALDCRWDIGFDQRADYDSSGHIV